MDNLPIVTIITVFGSAVLITLVVMIFCYLNNRNRYKVMETAIKTGKDLPEDFFKRKETPLINRLQIGLVWIAVGIGFTLFGMIEHEDSLVGFATIPILIGVAYVGTYLILKKDKKQDQSIKDEQQA